MSWKALYWAAEQKAGGSKNKLVLLALANMCNEENQCYPSYRYLSKVTELSEKSIQRAISDLCNLGLVVKEARFREAAQTSNVYTLRVVIQAMGGSQGDHGGVDRVTTKPKNNKPKNKQINISKETGKTEYPEEFLDFWREYPRKDGSKFAACQAWIKVISQGVAQPVLLDCAKKFAVEISANGTAKKYIPHASTWLNQRRFETISNKSNVRSKNYLAG